MTARRGVVPALSLVAMLAACGRPSAPAPSPWPESDPIAPDSFTVRFETSRGPFEVLVHREWSPLAADRVYALARRKVWDDIRIFRVVPNFVVQFGLTGDSTVNRVWRDRGLPDEPVREANRRGRVSFARAGPGTRSLQVFINLRDNTPRLDTLPAGGIVGYPPFGEVVTGMVSVDSLYGGYGNAPSQRQDSIAVQGNAYLDRVYPLLDRIHRARIVRRD